MGSEWPGLRRPELLATCASFQGILLFACLVPPGSPVPYRGTGITSPAPARCSSVGEPPVWKPSGQGANTPASDSLKENAQEQYPPEVTRICSGVFPLFIRLPPMDSEAPETTGAGKASDGEPKQDPPVTERRIPATPATSRGNNALYKPPAALCVRPPACRVWKNILLNKHLLFR